MAEWHDHHPRARPRPPGPAVRGALPRPAARGVRRCAGQSPGHGARPPGCDPRLPRARRGLGAHRGGPSVAPDRGPAGAGSASRLAHRPGPPRRAHIPEWPSGMTTTPAPAPAPLAPPSAALSRALPPEAYAAALAGLPGMGPARLAAILACLAPAEGWAHVAAGRPWRQTEVLLALGVRADSLTALALRAEPTSLNGRVA